MKAFQLSILQDAMLGGCSDRWVRNVLLECQSGDLQLYSLEAVGPPKKMNTIFDYAGFCGGRRCIGLFGRCAFAPSRCDAPCYLKVCCVVLKEGCYIVLPCVDLHVWLRSCLLGCGLIGWLSHASDPVFYASQYNACDRCHAASSRVICCDSRVCISFLYICQPCFMPCWLMKGVACVVCIGSLLGRLLCSGV